MIEWWTYTLGDFLMFAPRTYWRLVDLHNAALWPAHVAVLLAGAAALVALWRRVAAPALCLLLALAWAGVGWAFHLRRYAAINWAAEGFAMAFFAEAVLWLVAVLVCLRAAPGQPPNTGAWTRPRAVGFVLWLAALAGYPLLTRWAGRPWSQAEVFGLMPDPTVLATLGSLLLLRGSALSRVWCLMLALVPLGWCGVGGATLLAMDDRTWPVLPAAGALTAWAAWPAWRRREV